MQFGEDHGQNCPMHMESLDRESRKHWAQFYTAWQKYIWFEQANEPSYAQTIVL